METLPIKIIESFDADHSEVSPSAAHRWIKCPGSIILKRELGLAGTTSEAAAEGTAAHWICEQALNAEDQGCDLEILGDFVGKTIRVNNTDIKGHKVTFDFLIDQVFIDHCFEYVSFCREISFGAEYTAVECRVPMNGILSDVDKETQGYIDFVTLTDKVLTIVDLKFGKNVQVDAQDNEQLKLYALGAYYLLSPFYDIDKVKMIIHQPRKDHVSEHTEEVNDLIVWHATEVVDALAAIEKGSREVNVGIKDQCLWCPVKDDCKPHYEELVKDMFGPTGELVDQNVLTEEEKVRIFLNKRSIINFLESMCKKLISDSIEDQKAPEGLMFTLGRGSRSWIDEDKADKALARQKIPVDERRTKPVLKTPPQIEKIIGAKHAIMSKYVLKTEGTPTLTAESDKKKPYVFEDVAEDFNNVKQEKKL